VDSVHTGRSLRAPPLSRRPSTVVVREISCCRTILPRPDCLHFAACQSLSSRLSHGFNPPPSPLSWRPLLPGDSPFAPCRTYPPHSTSDARCGPFAIESVTPAEISAFPALSLCSSRPSDGGASLPSWVSATEAWSGCADPPNDLLRFPSVYAEEHFDSVAIFSPSLPVVLTQPGLCLLGSQ